VTGAADDDPSGIGTYSQVGAQFGYGLAWTMLFSLPLMTAIQEIAARIGCVTGCGIAQNLRRHYPIWLLRGVVLLLIIANVINLAADLGAMGAALGLLVGGPGRLYAVSFGVLCILLETFISYARYAAVLKWATLSLFAIGIMATGKLAVPVLAGSAAYGVSEVFGWTEGLDRRLKEAKAFHATIALATLGGVALNFTPLDPIKALYWSAVVNGVLAAPLMAVMMLIAMNKAIMGRLTLPPAMFVIGWVATAAMAVATIAFFVI
jgi:Mn2+/Fe2+ NRAMP family transporter